MPRYCLISQPTIFILSLRIKKMLRLSNFNRRVAHPRVVLLYVNVNLTAEASVSHQRSYLLRATVQCLGNLWQSEGGSVCLQRPRMGKCCQLNYLLRPCIVWKLMCGVHSCGQAVCSMNYCQLLDTSNLFRKCRLCYYISHLNILRIDKIIYLFYILK